MTSSVSSPAQRSVPSPRAGPPEGQPATAPGQAPQPRPVSPTPPPRSAEPPPSTNHHLVPPADASVATGGAQRRRRNRWLLGGAGGVVSGGVTAGVVWGFGIVVNPFGLAALGLVVGGVACGRIASAIRQHQLDSDKEEAEVVKVKAVADSLSARQGTIHELITYLLDGRCQNVTSCAAKKILDEACKKAHALLCNLVLAQLREVAHPLAAKGDADALTNFVEKVADYLSDPKMQSLPSFPAAASDLANELGPASHLSKILVDTAESSRRRILDAGSPYYARMRWLDNLLYETPYTNFNMDAFLRAFKPALVQAGLETAVHLVAARAGLSMGDNEPTNNKTKKEDAAAGKSAKETEKARQLYKSSKALVEAFKTGCKEAFSSREEAEARMREIHRTIQTVYEGELAGLPDAWVRRIQQLDKSIDEQLVRGSLELFTTALKRRQGLLLSYPTEVRRLLAVRTSGWNVKRTDQEVTQRTEDFVRSYLPGSQDSELFAAQEEFAMNLKMALERIRLNSMMRTPQWREQLYCYGEPGVGKSYFIRALGSALGLPVMPVSLSSDKDISHLSGDDISLSDHQAMNPNVTEEALVGSIQLAIIKSGVKNPILHFDEGGGVLAGLDESDTRSNYRSRHNLTKFKHLFDSAERTTLPVKGLGPGLELDFMHPIIAITGNRPITDAALRERFVTLSFPALSRSKKEAIAKATIGPAVDNIKDIDTEARESIRARVLGWLPLILAEDERRGLAGARGIIKAINSAVASAMLQTQKDRPTSEAEMLSELKARLDLGYRQCMPPKDAEQKGQQPQNSGSRQPFSLSPSYPQQVIFRN